MIPALEKLLFREVEEYSCGMVRAGLSPGKGRGLFVTEDVAEDCVLCIAPAVSWAKNHTSSEIMELFHLMPEMLDQSPLIRCLSPSVSEGLDDDLWT
jgi:hypothetical protein